MRKGNMYECLTFLYPSEIKSSYDNFNHFFNYYIYSKHNK